MNSQMLYCDNTVLIILVLICNVLSAARTFLLQSHGKPIYSYSIGFRVVLHRSSDNTSAARIELEKQLECIGAKRTGTFSVDCHLYIPTNVELIGTKGQRQVIHLCHHSEYPSSSFSIIGDNPSASPHLVSDRHFDGLMTTMQGIPFIFNVLKKHKQSNATVECKGQKYSVGDFLILIGDVVISGTVKGILIQIEFTPSIIASSCTGMMQEIAQNLLGSPVAIPGHVAKGQKSQQMAEIAAQQQNQQQFQTQLPNAGNYNVLGQSQQMNTAAGMAQGMNMQMR